MIGIIDYGVGNIFSIKKSFQHIGVQAELISSPEEFIGIDKLILPGVGAFGDAMKKLNSSGMKKIVLTAVENNIPLLGICLGMQLLFSKSYEYGLHEGLNIIPGDIVNMEGLVQDKSLKIPQMGWNSLQFPKDRPKSKLFKYVDEGEYVYFVHSFAGVNCEESLIATADYSFPVTAAVGKDNVYGTQFHPEKSGDTGLNILRGFCEL